MLVGATTENPYFEVNSALLSRCRVYELRRLEDEHVLALLRRALGDPDRGHRRTRPRWPTTPWSSSPRARAATPARRSPRSSSRARRRAGAKVTLAPRRGRAPAQGGALRQGRRPPLRHDLGLDQVHARVGPGRGAALPGDDARGRRGPALHRAPDGDPGERGHRQRRPAGAAGGGGGGACRRARRDAGVRAEPGPGGGLPGACPEVERRRRRRSAAPAAGCASTAPPTSRRTSSPPRTTARSSSAAARATTTRTTAPRASRTRS